jgi:hypothetical protein
VEIASASSTLRGVEGFAATASRTPYDSSFASDSSRLGGVEGSEAVRTRIHQLVFFTALLISSHVIGGDGNSRHLGFNVANSNRRGMHDGERYGTQILALVGEQR